MANLHVLRQTEKNDIMNEAYQSGKFAFALYLPSFEEMLLLRLLNIVRILRWTNAFMQEGRLSCSECYSD